MTETCEPAVWFPTVRAGSGTDVFTERLAAGLQERGIRAEITWLPLRAEYAPWTVAVPRPPAWANVAHVNTWLPPPFLPKGLPIVATLHHSMHHPDTLAYKSALRAAYHRFWILPNERRVLHRANRVIAVSQFVAETAKRTLLDVPMEVIYNGVDTEVFQPKDRQRLSGEPFRLLYVGKWVPLKGVDLLAPIMRELGEGFELRYTGGHAAGRDKPSMPDNMHDIGRLSDVESVVTAMQDADALLFPSRSEGLPLVVIEAMACGLPVIASRGSSLAELIVDGTTGWLCDADDSAAFAAAACTLLDMPALWFMLSATAVKRAREFFSVTRMVDSYVDAYIELFVRSNLSRHRRLVT